MGVAVRNGALGAAFHSCLVTNTTEVPRAAPKALLLDDATAAAVGSCSRREILILIITSLALLLLRCKVVRGVLVDVLRVRVHLIGHARNNV